MADWTYRVTKYSETDGVEQFYVTYTSDAMVASGSVTGTLKTDGPCDEPTLRRRIVKAGFPDGGLDDAFARARANFMQREG